MSYADVILPLPLNSLFTYAVPPELRERVAFGKRVVVPFGKQKVTTAMTVRTHDRAPEGVEVKAIRDVVDDAPVLLPEQFRLWKWLGDYYMAPMGDIYKAALPAGMKAEENYRPKTETCVDLPEKMRSERSLHVALDILARASKQLKAFETFLAMSHWDTIDEEGRCRQQPTAVTRDELTNEAHCSSATVAELAKRGLLRLFEREVTRINDGGEPHPERIQALSMAQQDAYNSIKFAFLRQDVTLLHGVTSSGKTEIYIHLIQEQIDRHRQVLYLLPEIALTVQMMQRLQRIFGNRLGIYHSKYSDAERVEIWKKQLSAAPYDVILGARSAVFLPFRHLGLVIVDEEHETSYKQQDPSPRYHARSAAIMLAQMYGAKTVLGSATPSLESWSNAQRGKYGYVPLMQRYQNLELPQTEVVDIQDLRRRKMMEGAFSPRLLSAVREALARGEQAIIFQNRRGFAPMVECKACGWVPHCEHCDVSLTYHKMLGQLTCHYCGYTYRIPEVCPCCGSRELRNRGVGTEKVEDDLSRLFPEARIARMDLDTAHTRSAYERILADFSAGKTNLLVGTQMVTKGLDFDHVSVVGILNADALLNYPDFRAYEHAYMMMEQVSGRAGRKGHRGLVVLQTHEPEHTVIRQVTDHDYADFYCEQMEERRQFNYPPFSNLIYVYLKHKDEHVVDSAGIEMGSRLRQVFGQRVLGPDRPAVAKIKTLSIRKVMLKLERSLPVADVRHRLLKIQADLLQDKRYNSLQVYYDVDPL